jgi:hypothetical protein
MSASPSIFADPTREYCYLSRLTSWTGIEGGIGSSVFTNKGEDMTLEVWFVSPCVVRARCFPPGAEPSPASPFLSDDASKRAPVQIEERGGRITTRSEALELRVVPSPFHYGVFDPSGRKLFVQQIGDVVDGQLVSMPLGFARDREGNVSFHESFELEPGEHLFGLPAAADVRGRQMTLRAEHSFLWSNQGCGILVPAASVDWEPGSPSPVTCSFRVNAAYLDYLLLFDHETTRLLALYAELIRRTA